jgi:DNA-binding CsgD family transcriptional regulator
MSIKFPANFKTIFALPIHVYWKGKDFRYLGCNDIMAENLNLRSNSAIIGKLDQDTIIEATTAYTYQQQDDEVFTSNQPHSYIDVGQYAGNQTIAFATYKIPLHNEKQQVVSVLGISVPITNPVFLDIHSQFKNNFNIQFPNLSLRNTEFMNTVHFSKLSKREFQCICLMVRGLSANSIGKKLGLSKRTIEDYIERAKNKLGCSNKAELIEYAISNHFLVNQAIFDID